MGYTIENTFLVACVKDTHVRMFRVWERVAEIKLGSSRFQAVFGFIDFIAYREVTADLNAKEKDDNDNQNNIDAALMNKIEIFRHFSNSLTVVLLKTGCETYPNINECVAFQSCNENVFFRTSDRQSF
uniref:AlNc14C252G9663 protein n=1 Tax=Albugo laibachii Nc14 TaxID=890382 RepID=F0WTI3_9STRA|nr:AlNc14C252G9663 [Albugo laibachii Nc14]|eukprot:CCA24674.1 AlNc14C252G9663 [Albugo laibachii Nc14]